MPDNLRINAPVAPNENVSGPAHAAEPPQQILPTNPNRVPGNGNQTENPGEQTAELLLNRSSVFGQFLSQLRLTPDLSKSLEGLLLSAVARQASIAARQPEGAPLRTLLENIPMEPSRASESLQFQQENATQFGGPLFRLLGQISEQSSNSGFDLRLADFLKAFSGYFSRQSTTLSILANLEQIRGEIPLSYAKKLQEVMRPLSAKEEPAGGRAPDAAKDEAPAPLPPGADRAQADARAAGADAEEAAGVRAGEGPDAVNGEAPASPLPGAGGAQAAGAEEAAGVRTGEGPDAANGEAPAPGAQANARAAGYAAGDRQTEENLSALKKDIIPFLAKYTAQTNDYGKTRQDVSMLLHNAAILNVSTKGNLEDRFGQLFRYCKYNLNLPDATMDLLSSLFGEEIAKQRGGKDDAFYSALTKLLSSAEGAAPAGADHAVLHDITRSVLLDNSVYMPFQHIFLPVEIEGRFLFAQMWIEKKEDEEGGRGHGGAAAQPTRVYLTFDIQDLGYFEAAVNLLDRRVELSLSYPPALDRFRGTIRSELASILESDGLGAAKVQVSPSASEKIPGIIREKIEERRSSVDVSV